MIPGTPGHWNGPPLRRRRSTISRNCRLCEAVGPCGTSNIRKIRIGSSINKDMADASILAQDALDLEKGWTLPDRGVVGITFLIITETALFTIFVVAYLVYMGKSPNGPQPKDVLEIPIFSTICLFSSSATIVMAERALHKRNLGGFKLWWLFTILLGLEFIVGTRLEWYHLIYKENLTISTNLFGTTYHSLVGLLASHVIVGLFFLM